MTTIHTLLDEYAAMSTDTRQKGLYLEKLTRAYLSTDPLWADEFEDMWLWSDWPGRDRKPDTGIDLVGQLKSGGLVAVQCKFYAPDHSIQKGEVDSFFSASGKAGFVQRIFVSTTSHWSKNAEDLLTGQQIPITRIGIEDLAESTIDWSKYSFAAPDEVTVKPPKQLRLHQEQALADVVTRLAGTDRGKLIMACGTGKTFTSLRIAEAIAGAGGRVLFLVPSIALLSQSLREWSAERSIPMRAFAICSDSKVGKMSEDYTVADLSYPATTDTPQLLAQAAKPVDADTMTVFFSTYQSIDVVARAQAEGLGEFDLVICDEAHRTAGFTVRGENGEYNESAFLRVHDATAIRAKKRLYMTATPKLYKESVKKQADEKAAILASMDDETLFGPVLHRLGFGEAVERDLLTDYRVLVLAVDEGAVGEEFQDAFAINGDLNIPEAARIVGIYNGLAKRGVEGLETEEERAPLRRAVAFSRSINDSKNVRALLNGYDGKYADQLTINGVRFQPTDHEGAQDGEGALRLEAEHVDGTMNVLLRNQLLDWLRSEQDVEDSVCRILTNARCLSEGVDVPSLDAVIFLNSRDSQVDVVQSVGRVMRKAEGKDYGYIILPIAVPADQTPEQALNDNTKFKVVWDVLRALRAHDERFEAMIEKIDLNGKPTKQLQFMDFTKREFDPEGPTGGQDADQVTRSTIPQQLDLKSLTAWEEAVYAKIVDKVGERDYWENWAGDVAAIAQRQQQRIAQLVDGSDEQIRAAFLRFVGGLQDNLNPSITDTDAIGALAQHLITQPIFDALFQGYSFSANNPVSQVMQAMVDALEGTNIESEQHSLEAFYESVRRSVSGIHDAGGRQTTIKRLYEKFFSGAFKDTSNRLGIVYTPNEVVDFLLTSADQILRNEFNATISDEGVHVLDGFTGTGTFIVRLLQSGLIKPADLVRKYRYELHANEIVLLAYYVAAVNIEETFHDIITAARGTTGYAADAYEPFPGIVLTDTFQSAEDDDTFDDDGVFGDNNERVKKQNQLDIRVIVGNPPYSSGQDSANDNNQNLKYPFLDKRIADTYAARSSAQNKNSLYDSYIRAIRWASNRLKDRGVIAFVSNGGFIDGNTADGLRKTLTDEFSSLYILNLRGNTRTSGEQARKEGGQTFGAGSRATIAISVLVKNPEADEHGRLHYRDIGDYLTRTQKLALLSEYEGINGVPWETIIPNDAGDWINARNDRFAAFTPIGDKNSRSSIFATYSRGLETGRDAWVYNESRSALESNVARMIESYNTELDRWNGSDKSATVEDFIDTNPARISWARSLRNALRKGTRLTFDPDAVTTSVYRPFNKQNVYFAPLLNHERSQMPKMFPTPEHHNHGFYMSGLGAQKSFSVMAVDTMPDLNLWGSEGGQFFPRYTYEQHCGHTELDIFGAGDAFTRVDNITDEILADYRRQYRPDVTKDEIFDFIYGLLHSPDYRATYAADLKKMLPRIPVLADPTHFDLFAAAGAELAELHLGYETQPEFPLIEERAPAASVRVQKMRFGGKAGSWDKSTLVYNDQITLSGIPEEAHEYLLGSRTALEWVMERYQVKTDKDSAITNDPNAWGAEHDAPGYILSLIKRIVTVSAETVRIVTGLPALEILQPEHLEPGTVGIAP
jgi:predicted helicase